MRLQDLAFCSPLNKLHKHYMKTKKTVWGLRGGFKGLGFAGSGARPGPPSWPQTYQKTIKKRVGKIIKTGLKKTMEKRFGKTKEKPWKNGSGKKTFS